MKTRTLLPLALAFTTLTVLGACDTDEPELALDAELESIDPAAELDLLGPDGQDSTVALACSPDDQASVGGLHYPGWTCADATAHAESTLSGYHYRNACAQQVGSDISTPAADAEVSSCTIVNGNAVVSVDLCCVPPPSLSCDPSEQAAVGGLHYPGWTCADATAHAEAALSGWHYRNACNQQVGSDISVPASEALVSGCTIVNGNAVVDVDLCCVSPVSSAIPSVTQKLCIAGGTAQQMQADCESDAQVWVNLFANGTLSTQQYINMWTDPCPAGTSIVPGSQFYAPGSCNPLPNIGAGCAGAGSFNYEFKLGVQCQ